MANDSMGNLEKLGILVIVILVVVVGVVAITPSDTLFQPEPEPPELAAAEIDPDAADGWDGWEQPSTTPDAPVAGGAADSTDDLWPPLRPRDVEETGTTPAPLPPVAPPAGTAGNAGSPPIRPPVDVPVVSAVVPPVPQPAPAPPAATPGHREYVVRSGDSLAKIAGRQSPPLRWVEIYRANPGMNPNVIVPGQVLKIPVAAATTAVDVVRRESGTPAGVRPAPTPATRGGAGATHVVRKGESLSGIAKRFLGKASRWQKIYEANRDVISDPDRVPAGITLRIPGTASTSAAPRRHVASDAPALPRFADATTLRGQSYKVERGDNLSRIAARFLGDADRWRDIFEANRDRISEPSKLRYGITIQIP